MNTPVSIFIILLCCLLLLRSSGVTGSQWMDEKTAEGKSEDSRELRPKPNLSSAETQRTDSRLHLMVLQNVLEKLQSRRLASLDRRQSRLPPCEVGASCSVKKGPRFGQLCDCQRGSKCNFFFLKCL